MSKKLRDEEEMAILNKKMNECGLHGFEYEIISDDYNDADMSDAADSEELCSEGKPETAKDKIICTSDWSSWQGTRGHSAWGVRVTEQIPNPISFIRKKTFRVKIKLNDEAVVNAKEISKAEMHLKSKAVDDFNKKYCNFLYCGLFVAGYSSPTQSEEMVNSSVNVEKRSRSSRAGVNEDKDLAQSWTVLPDFNAKKSDYVPVWKIIEIQAHATGNKDLQKAAELMKMHREVPPGKNAKSFHYVVLLGDVGTGKSTIVEKLTGETGRSSDDSESVTRISESFWVPDTCLLISDTPGTNPITDKLEHNIWLAHALNFRPVSRIFIVVKAEPRIASVVDKMSKYVDRFSLLDVDVIGVLVTHLDKVGWTQETFAQLIRDELDIKWIVFSGLDTKREELLEAILSTCQDSHDISIHSDNFSTLFKVRKSYFKILKFTNDEVKDFLRKKEAFDEAKKNYIGQDAVDLVFEFFTYMTKEIEEAKKRMSTEMSFTDNGENAANERGHIANLVNQLRAIIYDVSEQSYAYKRKFSEGEYRKCPHCGEIWTKVGDCCNNTTCGNGVPDTKDSTVSSEVILGTFSFKWTKKHLEITKNKSNRCIASPRLGCGERITWNDMAPFTERHEFNQISMLNSNEATKSQAGSIGSNPNTSLIGSFCTLC